MFDRLSSIVDVCGEDNVYPQFAKNEIVQHSTALEKEFCRYFPELSDDELDLVRNTFKLSVEKVPDHCKDEFQELMTDSGVRDMFDEKSIAEYWLLMVDSNPEVTEIAICALILFVSTYLCKSGFSTLLQIKTKQ